MALTLIKENGSGLVNANAYANEADCDAYHEAHLYPSAWLAAAQPQRDAALVMATRLIDAEIRFAGYRIKQTQALQWPRVDCPDADSDGETIPSDSIPRILRDATCEQAREMIFLDRTATPEGEGLKYLLDGTTQKGFDKADKRLVLSAAVLALLSKIGEPMNRRSGVVKLTRS